MLTYLQLMMLCFLCKPMASRTTELHTCTVFCRQRCFMLYKRKWDLGRGLMTTQEGQRLLRSQSIQVVLVVKNLLDNTGDLRDVGSIPGSGRFPWRRAWQPTPVFLPGESHGQRSLAGYSPWGCEESDMQGFVGCLQA